jgi:hypothetical protein
MDGPLTCEQLRNIRPMVIDMETKKFVDDIVNRIKQDIINVSFEQSKLGYQSHYGMLYRHKADITSRMNTRDYKMDTTELLFHKKDKLFEMVIDSLKQKFPDMKITPDPMYTYILCDWS